MVWLLTEDNCLVDVGPRANRFTGLNDGLVDFLQMFVSLVLETTDSV